MPSTPPMGGAHQFHTANSQVEGVQTDAIVFIAERMAGIEWLLSEINEKMFKMQTDLTQINYKTKP